MKFKQYIYQINRLFVLKKYRLSIANELLISSLEHADLKPLSQEQLSAVDAVWGSYKGTFDPRWFEFYNFIHPEVGTEIAWFLPLDFWLAYVDPQLVSPTGADSLDDKNLYDLLMPDVKQPRTVARFVAGMCLDSKYEVIDFETCLAMCQKVGRVIVKPATISCGGSGIFVWDAAHDTSEILKKTLTSGENYILQELVEQHPIMSLSNESSCNTIRIQSLIVDGHVHVFPQSFTRLGGSGKVIDNISSGGYYAGVDADGRISNKVRDHWQRVATLNLGERIIPNYDKCLEIAEKLAPRFAHTAKIISWDFAIDQQGDPVLIELNLGRTDFQSYQCLYGPFYKDFVSFFQGVAKNSFVTNSSIVKLIDKKISRAYFKSK